MSYGIVFNIKEERFLLTKKDGGLLGFEDVESAAGYMAMIAEKNAEINGPMASLVFITILDFGLIKYPKDHTSISKYFEDYDKETNKAKLHVHGVAGVCMPGLRVKNAISRIKYVPKDPKKKDEQKPVEPEDPKASSDNQDPYEKRD
jgi:hypothetical protein